MAKGGKDLGTGKTQSHLVQAAHRHISLTAKGIEIRRAGQDPVSGAGREPHPAGRQDPTGRDPHPRGHANHTVSGKAQSYERAARPSQRGKQRPPHGRQRPSSSRAPTSTSRRAGIGQGDLPHTKATTSSLRMQGDRKEQHSSHSLNQWKERFDLQQIHAGMLTRGEPYKLRGILNKEPRSLRTWFGPSPERGPGTQPTNSK